MTAELGLHTQSWLMAQLAAGLRCPTLTDHSDQGLGVEFHALHDTPFAVITLA